MAKDSKKKTKKKEKELKKSLEKKFKKELMNAMTCNGCSKHCPLTKPKCKKGRKKAEKLGL